jgi:hypothetical protein
MVTLVLAGGLRWPSVGPGLGLSNVLLYRGIGEGSTTLAVTLATLVAAGAAAAAWRMRELSFAALAAAGLVALWFLPSASPHAVATALALMVLAATSTDRPSQP